MAMVTPKTIVITSLPSRSNIMVSRPLSSVAASLPLAVTEGLGINGEPKKRKRLTNLSPEERLMRRKLKNRVAAQTARDRKKQRMDELEVLLAQVEADNKRLQAENDALRRRTGKLSAENSQLKEKLGGVGEMAVVSESPESAVLKRPQQQEQIQTPLPSTTPSRLLQMMITLSLMCCLASSRSSPKASSKKRRSVVRKRLSPSLPHRPPPHLTWWGPRQQSWNPSMN